MMNKKELTRVIAERAKLSLSQAEEVLVHTFEVIKHLMVNKQSIQIPGFGSFGSKVRAARKGRNPNTGKEIQIPEAVVPYFKAGTQLKEAVNEGNKD